MILAIAASSQVVHPTLHNPKAAAQNEVSLQLRSILYLVPPILFVLLNNINCTPTLSVYLTLFFILYKKKIWDL